MSTTLMGIIVAIVGITVVLAEGLIGVLKMAMNKLFENEQDRMLKAIYDAQTRCDSDGTPLTYTPRSWANTQKDVVTMLGHMTSTIADIAATQQRTLDIIDRLERRLEKQED